MQKAEAAYTFLCGCLDLFYNWKNLKDDGYKWWIERIRQAGNMYDLTRIDHFRAFADYWSVPAEAENAKSGKWMPGPGIDFFNTLKDKLPGSRIFAEDLGAIDKKVEKLILDTGFAGMRVMQFGFTPGEDSRHLPHNYPKNCVAYTGTHDNNTILGWLWEAKPDERTFALRYCGYHGGRWGDGGYKSESCRAIIETLWKSAANITVLPLQDMCGFGSDARLNRPGVAEGNWLFRATKNTLDGIDREYFREINHVFKRDYPAY